ncbi:MAG: D-alanyl-D-alanine carboxypeptidase/D-alanyl-D-alanine-endopeptidase [Brumimicrobium sp.]|nr:D-alanyl-D-alanine carboxypeptidase/D-alanyl-D-alanine-endopeptidase [Brumimicrobium sp.]MCO5267773.1 D-alanyl-D-alanine carboxypeptidase/D-alanyl-D-alanine-endopeptidase [Brumimicrobium sp.]
MKIVTIILFYLFFSYISFAQTANYKIQQAIEAFSKEEGLENAAISFMAYNLKKDSVIASFNSQMAIPSASITKLFSTALALEVLGKNYRPKTEIYYDGEIDSLGILHGNIIVRGLGDPTLGSRFFYKREERDTFLSDWVLALSKLGIQSIDGRIIADGSAFGYMGVPDGWTWSDMGNYYGAGASACAIYDNMTYLHFSTSNEVNGTTSIDSLSPPISGLRIFNQVTTSNASGDNSYIYGAPYSLDWIAIGNLPRNKTNFEVKASIPDPELLLAQVFQDAMTKSGISVAYPAIGWRSVLTDSEDSLKIGSILDYTKLKLLLTYSGKSIEEIVRWTNLQSVNFFAEQLLNLVAFEKLKKTNFSTSASYANNYWSGRLDVTMFQTDGSGLSRNNAFSANHFVQLLKYMYKSKNFVDFENSLPVAGKSGTLTSVCRGQVAQGKLKAKSGTLNRVKSYAGYIDNISGDKIAFSITVNNFNIPSSQMVKKMERIFNLLTEM